jgi:hypothetical protein
MDFIFFSLTFIFVIKNENTLHKFSYFVNKTMAEENLIKAIACPIEGDWMFDTTIKI